MNAFTVQDHPRACGKHVTCIIWTTANIGSPPRLRETQDLHGLSVELGRITPAPAGNTFDGEEPALRTGDHPRACGKHPPCMYLFTYTLGSPPRLRETLYAQKKQMGAVRITPAPAGNTGDGYCVGYPDEDHPRACGKHIIETHITPDHVGSPPRLRETLIPLPDLYAAHGITPAPAGNTSSSASSSLIIWDHPRACGKHLQPLPRPFQPGGSPPRLRETRPPTNQRTRFTRITPAPAGNTLVISGKITGRRDHPRACGKHGEHANISRVFQGSPPRLRETHYRDTHHTGPCRITPAPAGNTSMV